MRIIAGSARGRPILAPKGRDTRPTLDRVKESLFGILQMRIPNARVLDLFAGSGSLGLEALSRGAEHAVLNDQSRECCALIRKNLEALRFTERAAVTQSDALQLLARLGGKAAFDIVFLDPPYQRGCADVLSALWAHRLVRQDGIIVLEHAMESPPPETAGAFLLTDRRKYGDTGLSFYTASQ